MASSIYGKRGCPACANKRATPENNLAALYPDVAAQWHPTLNGGITPDQVPAGSGKRFWWICTRGHEWEREVEKRTKARRGCPYCANKQLPGALARKQLRKAAGLDLQGSARSPGSIPEGRRHGRLGHQQSEVHRRAHSRPSSSEAPEDKPC